MKPINWGIVAPGRIANKFAQDIAQVPNAKLLAISSRELTRAQEFAATYSIPHAYGSYEEMLGCPGLDAVYIASPHTLHHEHTLLFLNAGIAVLCEKPFAMNGRLVEQMIARANEKQVFLMEALWSRFMPATNKLLDLINEGVIGDVVGIKADCGFNVPFDPAKRLFDKSLGGGAVLDIGIYPLFLSYLVFGMPDSLKASAIMGATETDLTTSMILTYQKKKFAFLDCSYVIKTRLEACIFGEKGLIRMHPRWQDTRMITVELYDGEIQTYEFDRDTWGYYYEIEEIGRCLREGKVQSSDWSWDDSRNLMRLLDDVREEIGMKYEGFD